MVELFHGYGSPTEYTWILDSGHERCKVATCRLLQNFLIFHCHCICASLRSHVKNGASIIDAPFLVHYYMPTKRNASRLASESRFSLVIFPPLLHIRPIKFRQDRLLNLGGAKRGEFLLEFFFVGDPLIGDGDIEGAAAGAGNCLVD